ncbi:MAG: UDP-2,3-diacylglucosamine diphosphatase LpxI [Deltaproteobacteria bacterium]|nr:UDP-2,3-diacylglucosamine diphosphatase LpxI [Deltaproteobacteria bacterium]
MHENQEKAPGRVGLVAGNGMFPVVFSRAARDRGMAVYAAAHKGEADEDELLPLVEKLCPVHVGELGKIIEFFRSHGVNQAVMAGGVTKAKLFSPDYFKPDELAVALLERLAHTADDHALRGFASVLEEHGIAVRAPTWLVPELLAPPGVWTKLPLAEEQRADAALGFDLAKKIGELDVGQCLVVAKGTVVAVEAIEGTDAAIRRAGELGAAGACVVKVKKPIQDERFDLPAVGVQTIRSMMAAGASVLAVEAGATVVFDKEEMVRLADEAGICIVGLEGAAE